jgi:hypothetical protein
MGKMEQRGTPLAYGVRAHAWAAPSERNLNLTAQVPRNLENARPIPIGFS